MSQTEHASPPTPAAPAPAPADPPRLGVISGDRACINCGFNLYGQPIVREPHYGLIIARCPECGTPAALQEYPLLGRWARRFAALITMLWLGVLLVLLVITLAGTTATAREAQATAIRPLTRAIGRAYAEYQRQLSQQNTNFGWGSDHDYTWVDPVWAASADRDAIIADAAALDAPTGGGSYVDWRQGLRELTFGAIWPLLFGLLWGVALLHIPRRRIALAAVPLMALAAAFSLLNFSPTAGMSFARSIALEWAGASGYWVMLASLTLPLAIGLVLGRPVARLLIRFLLPPRLRTPLSVLWTADNLPPPRDSARAPR